MSCRCHWLASGLGAWLALLGPRNCASATAACLRWNETRSSRISNHEPTEFPYGHTARQQSFLPLETQRDMPDGIGYGVRLVLAALHSVSCTLNNQAPGAKARVI